MSALERRLVESVGAGVSCSTLSGQGTPTPDDIASWSVDADRVVRASVIRDILLGRLGGVSDPKGLRLRGVVVPEPLDLAWLVTALPIELAYCRLDHGLDLRGAHLRALDLSGSALSNAHGPALYGDLLQVDASVTLTSGFCARATGTIADGAVRMLGAKLGGQLNLAGANLTATTGPALHADGLRVAGSVVLACDSRTGKRFTAQGAGPAGVIRLVGADIGIQLNMSGAKVVNPKGPALVADGVKVGGAGYLGVDEGSQQTLEASGSGPAGVIMLNGAHFGASLYLDGAQLASADGPALYADRLRVEGRAMMSFDSRSGKVMSAVGAGDKGVVRLKNAVLGGLEIESNAARNTGENQADACWVVEGMTYGGLPQVVSTADWIRLLARQTPDYSAQPYQQFAAAARSAGHDSDARQALMAQRRDQLLRAPLTRGQRVWTRFTGYTLGYGYQPWRALIGLIAIFLVALVATFTLGAHGGLRQNSSARTADAPAPCTWTETVAVSIAASVPLLPKDATSSCAPTATARGNALTVCGWVLQLLAWAAATLFIAGFTSAVRRP